MKGDLRKKLLQKEMSRGEFLQFVGGSVIVLLGFGNFIAMISRFVKTGEQPVTIETKRDPSHGFGSRKFGA